MFWPRWFRIVSTAIAVLPVVRSPMMSSRWPRPIGIIESIALRPVCTGSFTGWRETTPGALNSSGRVSLVTIGPWPSSGLPSGSTTRPSRASPTGTLATLPVRRTGWPSLILSQAPKSAAPTSSSSRLNASPTTPCSSSSISIATAFSSPWMRAMPSPTDRTVPTSARSALTSKSSMRCLRIDVISSGRSFTWAPWLSRHERLAKSFEPAADARVDAARADLEDDPADEARVDAAGHLDRAAGRLLDLGDDRARFLVRQLERGRELDGEPPLVLGDEAVELLHDPLELSGAALLGGQQEEVPRERVGAAGDLAQRGDARGRGDLGVVEEGAQLVVLARGRDERGQLLVDRLDASLLPRGLEQRARV